MIKVTNLTKEYEIKNQSPLKALDNVSFILPDKGLVFITGKSGSGKTTFLNLLGGLDNISSGNIVADGISFNDMSVQDYQKYRATYLGFVFQDFCLIDSLTIYDNIKIALDIIDKEDNKKIDDLLDSVGLLDYKDRYPNQLSAGQKQRVAILRALVKSPKLILCDEPTGNLDSKTSKQILNLLKELSKERLIVVVSHNMDDAYYYADRIIELSDGRVISDVSYEQNDISSGEETLYLGNVNALNEEDIILINNKLKNGQIKAIRPKKELLINSINEESITNESKLELKTTKYPFKKSKKLSHIFLKRRLINSIVSSFFTALLVTIFGLCEMFAMFDSKEIVHNTLSSNDQKALIMQKAHYDENNDYINTSYFVKVNDNDMNLISESLYDGNVYTLYNYSIPISLGSWNVQSEVNISDTSNFIKFYCQETYGVLVTDEEFIKTVFDFKDAIKFDALSSDIKDYGVYITDYVADSILFFRKDKFNTYDDILGEYKNDAVYNQTIYGYINGVIDTGYDTKYKDVIDQFMELNENFDSSKYFDLIDTDEYLNFYEFGKRYLSICYSTNPDFISASKSPLARSIARFDFSKAYIPDTEYEYEFRTAYGYYDSTLPSNTISISYEYLGNLIGEQLTYEEAVVKLKLIKLGNELDSLTLSKYSYEALTNNYDPLFERIINVEIHEDTNHTFFFSDDLFTFLRGYDVIPYSLYFSNLKTAEAAYDALIDVPFVPSNSYVEAALGVGEVVDIFSDFYILVAALLCIASLFVIISYAINIVNSRRKDIGILKALGASNKDLNIVFVYMILIIGLLTGLIYTGGLFILMKVGNKILLDSFMNFIRNPALRHISIISFQPSAFIIDIIVILSVTVIAALIPLLLMRKIKPLNIIKSKD